jgi:hypothetical protein
MRHNIEGFRPGSSKAGPTLDQSLVAVSRLVNLCITAGVVRLFSLCLAFPFAFRFPSPFVWAF